MRIARTAAEEPQRAAIWTLAVMRARADESHAPLPESARNTVRAALRFVDRGVLPEE